jgi:hypothetical protein
VAVIIALSCWHDSPQQHKKTTRVWLCLAAVAIIAVMAVWFRGWLRIKLSLPTKIWANAADVGASGWAASTMIIYAVALIVGLVKIRSLRARYANSRPKNWVTRGLKLVRWGADLSLGYTFVFLAGVLAPFFGTTIPYWYAVTVPATVTSTILMDVGFALPLLGPALVDIRRNLADMRAHRALKPLWEDLVLDNPHIALRESDRRKIGYRLHRRVVEIRDGITHLSEFITPDDVASDLSGRARTAARQLRRAMTEKNRPQQQHRRLPRRLRAPGRRQPKRQRRRGNPLAVPTRQTLRPAGQENPVTPTFPIMGMNDRNRKRR